VFHMMPDGLAYVKEGDKIYAAAVGNPQGADGLAYFADDRLSDVVEAAEECPGECIFLEAE
jgi:ferredoxin